MPPEETANDLQKIIELAWRRKWVILTPFAVIFTAGTLWALYQPNLYRSTSSIIIEAQKVPTEYVRSTVTADLEGRLRTVTQQMTSRTKLLKVISELDLYPEEKALGVPSEVMVARMRTDLEVEIPRAGRGDANFFTVSYLHRDPTKAMLAVSRLVSLFIEESLQVREQQAAGTTTFIEEELAKLKVVLEEQEESIREYKSRNMGELPSQLEANLRMLDNLQLQLANNRESQREVEDRILLLEQEMSRLEGEIKVATTLSGNGTSEPVTNTTLNQLLAQRDALRQRVASMESTYTERHPDLIAARRDLARLDESLKSVTDNLAGSGRSTASVTTSVPAYSTELTNLRRQLNEIKPRLSAFQEEESDLKRRIFQYQRRVEAAPEREQRLLQLTRDYENTKASYEDLLNKKLEAQLSENLEKRQKGENFQILDPANFPEKPFLPNRPKLVAMTFAGGMGLGVGLALFLEALFPAFYSLKQLQMVTEAPITFGVPYIISRAERTNRRRRAAVVAGAGLTVFIILLVVVDLYIIDLGVFVKTIGHNLKGMM